MAEIATVCCREVGSTLASCLGAIVAGETRACHLRVVNAVVSNSPIGRRVARFARICGRQVRITFACRLYSVVAGEARA